MTDANAPAPSQTTGKPAESQVTEEWKPEPRQWTWKDIFTAPMLAFKPKCMLVTALTVIGLGLWFSIKPDGRDLFGAGTWSWVGPTLDFAWLAAGLVVFSLAATLVAVFMKADLLDDEFLSFGEAFGQYKKRLVPAILVPLFLLGLYGGFKLLLAGAELLGSIPVAGPTVYALFYPLGFLLGLFLMLLLIAVVLSVFVFPSIIAIRKHGWFDNVVDTFEAVGTKPHILVGSGLLTVLMICIAAWIGFGAMSEVRDMNSVMFGNRLDQTEAHATSLRKDSVTKVLNPLSDLAGKNNALSTRFPGLPSAGDVIAFVKNLAAPSTAYNKYIETSYEYMSGESRQQLSRDADSYYKVTGIVTGVWQVILTALLLGYCLNLFIGGGMLTYLVVREDDYWDDEDLEDLDQLAKELEEEAKAEAAKGAAPSVTPTVPAAEAKPAEPSPAPPAP
jgi:hypothetical protein